MAHVLVRNNKVVKTIARDRPLRTEENANGGRRYQVADGVVIYIGGTVTLTDGKVSAITNPNPLTVAQQRRIEVKRWLRMAIDQPFYLMASANAGRTQNILYWLNMIAKASAVDANLSNASKFRTLGTELNFQPRKWFDSHNAASWGAVTGANAASPLVFYNTASNNGNAMRRNNIDMTADAQAYLNIIKYLEE